MIVKENIPLISKKHFLLRALNLRTISQEEFDRKYAGLDNEIWANTQKRLLEEQEKIKNEVKEIKKTTKEDGNMKRAVANLLIKFLSSDFTDEEIKGIMRQGYKIQRSK